MKIKNILKKSETKIVLSSAVIGILILSLVSLTQNTPEFAGVSESFQSNSLAQSSGSGSSILLGTPSSNPEGSSSGGGPDGYIPITGEGPGSLFEGVDSLTLRGLVEQAFIWGLGVAIILSILFVAIGSVQYMTTDAISGQEEGRKRITAAIAGLILALVSWVILNEINPATLNTGILIDNQQITLGARKSGGSNAKKPSVSLEATQRIDDLRKQDEQVKAQAEQLYKDYEDGKITETELDNELLKLGAERLEIRKQQQEAFESGLNREDESFTNAFLKESGAETVDLIKTQITSDIAKGIYTETLKTAVPSIKLYNLYKGVRSIFSSD